MHRRIPPFQRVPSSPSRTARGLVVCFGTLVLAFAVISFDHGLMAQQEAAKNSDLRMVQDLMMARRDYQKSLEQLRAHYLRTGDVERAQWALEELLAFHRMPHRAFRLKLDVPPENLRGTTNIPAANRLYTRALQFKGQGRTPQEFRDNQRRAELLLQQLLTHYRQSNRVSDAAYQLGDIYESAAYKHYARSALYFERCFQWNSATQFDARLRAARIYDRYLSDRRKAMDIYKQIPTNETDAKRIQEAVRRMRELGGQ